MADLLCPSVCKCPFPDDRTLPKEPKPTSDAPRGQREVVAVDGGKGQRPEAAEEASAQQ